MNCPRCTGLGLMVRNDLQDETGLERFAAWRCLICGEVLDLVILENRSAASKLMVERASLAQCAMCIDRENRGE